MTLSSGKMFKIYASIHFQYPIQQVMKSCLIYLNLFKDHFWLQDLGLSIARRDF